jgi:hypothetical protein
MHKVLVCIEGDSFYDFWTHFLISHIHVLRPKFDSRKVYYIVIQRYFIYFIEDLTGFPDFFPWQYWLGFELRALCLPLEPCP